MDEMTAWKRFTETGSVNDYINYCRIKLGKPTELRNVQNAVSENDRTIINDDIYKNKWE